MDGIIQFHHMNSNLAFGEFSWESVRRRHEKTQNACTNSAAIGWTISVFGAFSDSCPRMNLKRMFLPTIKIQRFMVREWLELFDAAISWKFRGIKEKATAPAPLQGVIHHHPALFRFQQVEKPSAKNVPCVLPCNLRCNRKQEDVLLMTEFNDLMEVPRSGRSTLQRSSEVEMCALKKLQPPDSEDYADTEIGFTIHASLFVPCYHVLLWPSFASCGLCEAYPNFHMTNCLSQEQNTGEGNSGLRISIFPSWRLRL